jgi:hypothetical protein
VVELLDAACHPLLRGLAVQQLEAGLHQLRTRHQAQHVGIRPQLLGELAGNAGLPHLAGRGTRR